MAVVTGELKKWHKVRIEATASSSFSEVSSTFTDYRMNVTFTGPSSQVYLVPGYFAADGDAAETSATSGTKWFCDFSPDEEGLWTYEIAFRNGTDIAANDPQSTGDGVGVHFNGQSGNFTVLANDKTYPDFRQRGRLEYVGERYLKFRQTSEYFIKCGADAPETFLAYDEFDNTVRGDTGKANTELKDYTPHVGDWNSGDPEWKTNQGRGIIGILNYLHDQGMNAQSFLPCNVDGDGRNVWPWASGTYSELNNATGTDANRTTYDVSKLAQWQIVFDHAQAKGIFLHFKLHETENDSNIMGSTMTTVRKIYYREMIARFGYLLALNWNCGEESDVGSTLQIAMAKYLKDFDPYQHHRVLHTYPGSVSSVYTPLLGSSSEYTGASLQSGLVGGGTGQECKTELEWLLSNSTSNGKVWASAYDEQNSANNGVAADDPYSAYLGRGSVADNRDEVRKNGLWATLMAGGWGAEYYYGYNTGTTDLNAEDHRSRATKWADAKIALDFFKTFAFWLMEPDDTIVSLSGAWAMKRDGEQYLVFLPSGGTTNLTVTGSGITYTVKWLDTRNGGALQDGPITSIGTGVQSLGAPPNNTTLDWAVLVTKDNPPPATANPEEFTFGNQDVGQIAFGSVPVNV